MSTANSKQLKAEFESLPKSLWGSLVNTVLWHKNKIMKIMGQKKFYYSEKNL
jgi:hypothetical protein